jgi:hypothetical protein
MTDHTPSKPARSFAATVRDAIRYARYVEQERENRVADYEKAARQGRLKEHATTMMHDVRADLAATRRHIADLQELAVVVEEAERAVAKRRAGVEASIGGESIVVALAAGPQGRAGG